MKWAGTIYLIILLRDKDSSWHIGPMSSAEREKVECVEYHRGITHGDPEFVGKYKTNWPFMFNDCGVCHNGQFNPRFNKTLTDVEDEDKKDCFQCHLFFTPPPVYEEGE